MNTAQPALLARLYDRLVLGHPRITLMLLTVAVGVLAMGIPRFRLDASAETLVLEGDRDLRYAREIAGRYSQEDFLLVTYTPRADLFSEESFARLARLRDDLRALPRVSAVRTILDVPLLETAASSVKDLTAEMPTLESSGVDPAAARKELVSSPLYRDLLLSRDARTTALIVYSRPDPEYDALLARQDALRQRSRQEGAAAGAEQFDRVEEALRRHRDAAGKRRHEDIVAVRGIVNKYRDGAELLLGGVSMIADDMITFIKRDLRVFGFGTAGALTVLLGVIFRRLRWVILPMLCCAAAAVSAIGLLGWLDWPVTVISANFISLQLIITMAIAVHLVVRYRELLAEQPEAPQRELVLDTVRLMSSPCTFAVLTTMAGFASLVLSDILPVIMLGWMMTLGLAVSLILTFVLLPAVLVGLPKTAPPRLSRWHVSLTAMLARLTAVGTRAIVVIAVAALAASGWGISRLEVENRFIDYFHPSTEIYRGMKLIDEQLGGTMPLDVIVEFESAAPVEPAASSAPEGDEGIEFALFEEFDAAASAEQYWFTREKMDRIKAAHRYLDSLDSTGKVLSLATTLAIVEKLNGGRPLDSLDLALLYNETPPQLKTLLIEPYVSVEQNQARFSVRVLDSDPFLRRDDLLRRVRAELPAAAGFEAGNVRLTGMMVLYNNMLQSLFRSQILTLGATMLLLTATFLVLFRSWRLALIAMAPNILPVAAVLGLMGFLGLPLDIMTITIAAISVGIAVDDTIHYLHRFRREFVIDRRYLPTMRRCHGSIGRAMYYTTITITLGLAVLTLSDFTPTVRFGLLAAAAMIAALIADLTLLPALLILVRPFGPEPETATPQPRPMRAAGKERP